ncbi:HD domain-containing protein [Geosporobacter subterraneus DSM 17957]|uniref:HD domain-containing protein n=1 Tax=Geosporobacter subterraneus DSM 17957 TaxID=1121919 RepID=A0A1M6BZJ7_9FIRM|nr:HD domain-containing phosphohydrolase [Geosporobacter subterraneus]SHI54160.1 HD domain-containing protein [Geosporobacter subterraneus DSM 17957]
MGNTKPNLYVKKQLRQLIPGDILLHPIYRTDGLMLINQYKTLSSDIIQKIIYHLPSNTHVLVVPSQDSYQQYIDEEQYRNAQYIDMLQEIILEHNKLMTVPLTMMSLLDPHVNVETMRQDSYSEKNYNPDNDYLDTLYKFPLFLSFENNLESAKLKERASRVRKKLYDIIRSNNVLCNALIPIKHYKDILLIHSMNTVSISLMIGLTIELTEEELVDLAITALLIDASLTRLPKETFNIHLQYSTKGKELYQVYVDFIKNISTELPMLRKESIFFGILDYYEHYDGGGYPKGKSGKDIGRFARIISMAHFYEEKVGGYFHNSGTKPRDAISLVWENKSKKFDPNIIDIFVRRSNFFKIGESIIIPEYGRGIITGFEDYINVPHMPIVKFENGVTVNLLTLHKHE